MKIAVDAMGGDFAHEATVDGAIQAARVSRGKYEIILVGDEHKIRKELSRFSIKNLSISIYHASEVIEMEESPTKALKQKKDASMVVASNLLKKGMADAVVSAGNTGAFMATSLLTLGRLPGVLRPGLGSFILKDEVVCVVLDVGDADGVAGTYVLPAVRVGHQVDAFGGVPGEDNLPVLAGVDEPPHLGPRALVAVSGLLAQGVDAPVHI